MRTFRTLEVNSGVANTANTRRARVCASLPPLIVRLAGRGSRRLAHNAARVWRDRAAVFAPRLSGIRTELVHIANHGLAFLGPA